MEHEITLGFGRLGSRVCDLGLHVYLKAHGQ